MFLNDSRSCNRGTSTYQQFAKCGHAQNLSRATLRLDFLPSRVLVGVDSLCTDTNLRKPAWVKCRRGVASARDAIVGLVLTSGFQKGLIELFFLPSESDSESGFVI
jgi:hypothetical protein